MSAVSALLVSLAVFSFMRPRPEPRLHRLMNSSANPRGSLTARQLGVAAAGLAAVGCVSLFGLIPGVPLAVVAAILVPRLTSRLESVEARETRQRLERQFPDSLDVLVSILEAGAPPAEALRAVGQAFGEPLGSELERSSRALHLGASMDQAWAGAHLVMQPLATAMIRSANSGAPLSVILSGASSDARREHRVRVEVAAQSAGVRAVAPLAACFLPAFFLVGVAPIIASFVEQLLHS